MCSRLDPTTTESSPKSAHMSAAPSLTRRRALGSLAAVGAAAGSTGVAGGAVRADARSASPRDRYERHKLTIVPLGTLGGPPPVAGRAGISTALVVEGKTYVIDCGRGAVSQYMNAGLSMPSLTGIFLTHLHADHTVDYFSFPLLCAGVSGKQGFQSPVGVWGPGPSGKSSAVTGEPGLGTVGLTDFQNNAFAASTGFFLDEHFGVDPVSLLEVHDVLPSDATFQDPAPTTAQPFDVMEDDRVRVTAIPVPHGAVFPAFAYRFDTDHGSVVFSGDTARTPNIPRIADGADVLVHEAADFAALESLGYPQAAIDHIKAVHTDVADLGAVAKESDVRSLLATHLSPGDRAVVSDRQWQGLLDQSRRKARFRGNVALAQELRPIAVRSR
jgi:ribonuclease BN (tRNA processing enzyme)